MTFSESPLPGVFVIAADAQSDVRGSFSRIFSSRSFSGQGLDSTLTEVSISSNTKRGTLRGMHFQFPPHAEAKLVRVVCGSVFDVAVDLRPESPTRLRWFGLELSRANRRAVYIPKGFAHGFLTLSDDTDVLYHITDTYHPDASSGFAWNDPSVGIAWPFDPVILSIRDRELPHLADL